MADVMNYSDLHPQESREQAEEPSAVPSFSAWVFAYSSDYRSG